MAKDETRHVPAFGSLIRWCRLALLAPPVLAQLVLLAPLALLALLALVLLVPELAMALALTALSRYTQPLLVHRTDPDSRRNTIR